MDRLFWFSLLFTYLPVTASIVEQNCLTQPPGVMEQKTGHLAVLTCIVSTDCSSPGVHYQWFVFKQNTHHRLNLHKNPHKFTLEGSSLHIKSLHVNDSGIYHCAAEWPGEPTHGKQYVGPGTTLLVREQHMPKYLLLWLTFALLAIYSLVIVTLVILKKFGCNVSCTGLHKTAKNESNKKATKRAQFRDVLEEMYTKKNLVRKKKTAARKSCQTEAASIDINSSNDDIYQNV